MDIECKSCGGINNGDSNVCEYCGRSLERRQSRTEQLNNLYDKANTLLSACEFDRAAIVFEKILDIDYKQSEAHWSLTLCKYGIEFVDDRFNGKMPTCHRTITSTIQSDINYQKAIENATDEEKDIYQNIANQIAEIQKQIMRVVKSEKPYDVFISYKETDEETGGVTTDSRVAYEIYEKLTNAGFNVFYSKMTLRNHAGKEYEPYIYAALSTAKVMILIGSRTEYFNAVWVKNEWSRFLHMIKNDDSKILIPCCNDPSDLPPELSNLQCTSMNNSFFVPNIVEDTKKYLNQLKAKPQYTQPEPQPAPQPTYSSSQPQAAVAYTPKKKKLSCGAVILIVIGIVFLFSILSSAISYFEKGTSASIKAETEPVIITEPPIVLGEETIELHEIEPVSEKLITKESDSGYVFGGVFWNGAFVYRAGNGTDTAFTVYDIEGKFEKLTFKATPLAYDGYFTSSSTAEIIIVNEETGDVLSTTELNFESEIVEIEADITGVNLLGIYVNKTGGMLAYTLIKDAYISPPEVNEATTNSETEVSEISN